MEEKVTKSMTIEKKCKFRPYRRNLYRKSFCLTFYIVQNIFSVYIESFFKFVFFTVHMVYITNFNPNSHRVGHIGPTLFWRQITKKHSKCKIFLK